MTLPEAQGGTLEGPKGVLKLDHETGEGLVGSVCEAVDRPGKRTGEGYGGRRQSRLQTLLRFPSGRA